MTVTLHPEARREVRESQRWYRQYGDDVARRFFGEFRSLVASIAAGPELFRERLPGVRRANFPTFPHHIIFLLKPDHLHLIAVAHDARLPNYWNSRISD